MPGMPHHVTQRGNRSQRTFFGDDDYRSYRALLAEHCAKAGVAVWAYCLMPNHVHLVLVPEQVDGLRRALAETHRRYTRRINLREDWRGYLWQGRFASFPLDEAHLLAAVRYVELNPARAGLVKRASSWPWSSAKAHLAGRDDELVATAPMLALVPDWRAYLREGLETAAHDLLRAHERTGRPLGSEGFVAGLEGRLDRQLAKRKPGPAKGTPRPPRRAPEEFVKARVSDLGSR